MFIPSAERRYYFEMSPFILSESNFSDLSKTFHHSVYKHITFHRSHLKAMSLLRWVSLSLNGPLDSIPSAVTAHSLFGNISIETLNS